MRRRWLRRVIALALLGSLAVPGTAATSGDATPDADQAALPQAWTVEDRAWFYAVSQGSQIMPYAWFMSLERPDDGRLFASDGLARFGYLANPLAGDGDALPIGFVKDVDDHGEWIGMTCAACHTGRMSYGGRSVLVDGAPTNADMYAFIAELSRALTRTAAAEDDPKFDGFAHRVLGPLADPGDRDHLFRTLGTFARSFSEYVVASTPAVPWGPGRLDAFGMIFNRATAIDLKLSKNNQEPSAPVSYPFLWDTSWHDRVQWNGSAPNQTVAERLGRNVGEVLGVFARADLDRSPTPLFFETSVKRLNLLAIENRLRSLEAPKWPAWFGPIDTARAQAGRGLYAAMCEKCHAVAPTGADRHQAVTLTPVTEVGTDPAMASNAATRVSATGPLEGVRMPLLLSVPPLSAKERSIDLVGHIVAGAILAPLDAASRGDLAGDQLTFIGSLGRKGLAASLLRNDLLNDVKALSGKADLVAFLAGRQATDPMVYKARSLDGIWATGPFLHNGSVPSLRQLLLPPSERMRSFLTGSREFDPVDVGFKTDAGVLFDTTLPGNSNAGHDYGVRTLTPEQRDELLEYIKTL